jgi:hypothetical protein
MSQRPPSARWACVRLEAWAAVAASPRGRPPRYVRVPGVSGLPPLPGASYARSAAALAAARLQRGPAARGSAPGLRRPPKAMPATAATGVAHPASASSAGTTLASLELPDGGESQSRLRQYLYCILNVDKNQMRWEPGRCRSSLAKSRRVWAFRDGQAAAFHLAAEPVMC